MTGLLIEQVKSLKSEAANALVTVRTAKELEQWRVRYIGRRGKMPLLLRRIKELPFTQRRTVGQAGNELRSHLTHVYEEKKTVLPNLEVPPQLKAATAPRATSPVPPPGHLHPLTLTIRRILDIFSRLGFLVVEGPEAEEARYNFDALNIPLEHPARAETDTFYLTTKGLVLRTQTSPVQIRAVLEYNLVPPFRILSPGRVFRAERTDATHETTFYQFEGLEVHQHISIADFKGVVQTVYSDFFEKEVRIRLRPSYFPFVEPGFEVDVNCTFCEQRGCRICKHTGWIEMMGAGMVHPNVLRNMNIDPNHWQGYAFGGAIDRLAMLRHGIADIRLLWLGDLRFLTQFS